jgi:hypothetical protein
MNAIAHVILSLLAFGGCCVLAGAFQVWAESRRRGE